MENQLQVYMEKCRFCLNDLYTQRIEIDAEIESNFFDLTQLNLLTSNLLSPYICKTCKNILDKCYDIKKKFISNQDMLEKLFYLDQYEEEEDVLIDEQFNEFQKNDEEDIIEVEEEIKKEQFDNIEEEYEIEVNESESEEEEIRLEDIVKPEYLHYCFPKPQKIDKAKQQRITIPASRSKKHPTSSREQKKTTTSTNKSAMLSNIKISKGKIELTDAERRNEHVQKFHHNFISHYMCDLCGLKTKNRTSLQSHMIKEHLKETNSNILRNYQIGNYKKVFKKC